MKKTKSTIIIAILIPIAIAALGLSTFNTFIYFYFQKLMEYLTALQTLMGNLELQYGFYWQLDQCLF